MGDVNLQPEMLAAPTAANCVCPCVCVWACIWHFEWCFESTSSEQNILSGVKRLEKFIIGFLRAAEL